MNQQTHLILPNGRQLDYTIRHSAKVGSLRLKLTVRDGLTVIAPLDFNKQRVAELVTGKGDWIMAKLNQLDEVSHLINKQEAARPDFFNLPAFSETWCVEYQKTRSKTVGARTERQGRILVYGSVDNYEHCKSALRRWLTRHAKQLLTPWLDAIATEADIQYSQVIIKNQRTRWGSCSDKGVISLNAKLLFLSPNLVRYVMVHELCHNLERNHTNLFWAYLRQSEPQTNSLHSQMHDAWKQVPAWAHLV